MCPPVQRPDITHLLPLSDSFRDEGLGEEGVVKGVAHSMPVSVPLFRRSPKKSSADNDDERVSACYQLVSATVTRLYTSLMYTVTRHISTRH